jgi:hypothetical protein
LSFHITFSETTKKRKSKLETAPDFDANFAYFARILADFEIYNSTWLWQE